MYQTATSLIFVSDGVVLDSNHLKTKAFRIAAQPYGDAAAQALVDYHVANGGVSRYAQFAHFLDHIVPEYAGAEKRGTSTAGKGGQGCNGSIDNRFSSGVSWC